MLERIWDVKVKIQQYVCTHEPDEQRHEKHASRFEWGEQRDRLNAPNSDEPDGAKQ